MLASIIKVHILCLVVLFVAACAHSPHEMASESNRVNASADVTIVDAAVVEDNVAVQVDGQSTDARQADDLWQRIRQQLQFTNLNHPRIARQIEQISHRPRDLQILSQRARPFLHPIVEAIEARGLPLDIALIPIIESSFEPLAVSPRKAAGLWQIMPATGKYLGLTLNRWYDGRYDLLASTAAALDYLAYLHKFFDGDWLLALAAYNAGEGRVQRAIKANAAAGRKTDYWHLDLPTATEVYVPKLLALSRLIAFPERYGVRLYPIPNQPYLQAIQVGPQLELAVVAAAVDMPLDDLRKFNASFKRGMTAPQLAHTLLLPQQKIPLLQAQLDDLPRVPLLPKRKRYYVVKRGDSLSTIAERHGIPYRRLASWNGLKLKSILRPGQKLALYKKKSI